MGGLPLVRRHRGRWRAGPAPPPDPLNFEGQAEGISPDAVIADILARTPEQGPEPQPQRMGPAQASRRRRPGRLRSGVSEEAGTCISSPEGLLHGRSRADRRTRRASNGIEFADHRDHAAGDDLRYLDWRCTAA